MAIPIIDFLIRLQAIGVWVSRERWCLVFRLGGGEIKRRIVMLVGFKIIMEVLEHSDLGLSI